MNGPSFGGVEFGFLVGISFASLVFVSQLLATIVKLVRRTATLEARVDRISDLESVGKSILKDRS